MQRSFREEDEGRNVFDDEAEWGGGSSRYAEPDAEGTIPVCRTGQKERLTGVEIDERARRKIKTYKSCATHYPFSFCAVLAVLYVRLWCLPGAKMRRRRVV